MNAPKKNKPIVSRVEMMDNNEANNLRASARNAYESMNYTNMELENIPLNNFTATPNREVPRSNAKFQTPNKPTRSIFGNVGNYPSNMPRKIGNMGNYLSNVPRKIGNMGTYLSNISHKIGISGGAKKTLRRRRKTSGRTRRNGRK